MSHYMTVRLMDIFVGQAEKGIKATFAMMHLLFVCFYEANNYFELRVSNLVKALLKMHTVVKKA